MLSTALIIITGVLFVLLLLFLCWPFAYSFKGSFHTDGDLSYHFYCGSPVFFLSRKFSNQKRITQISILGLKVKDISHEANKHKTNSQESAQLRDGRESKIEKEKHTDSKRKQAGWAFFKRNFTRENIEYLMVFLKDIFSYFRPRSGELSCRIGLSDPCYNGMILGWYHGISSHYFSLPLSLDVVWEEEVIETHGRFSGRFIPAFVFWRIIRFLLSVRMMRIFWDWHRYKR